MMPAIPEVLSTEEFTRLHLSMIADDPDHRWFTGLRFGRDPSYDERAQHWYESGAAINFTNALIAIAQNRQVA